MNKLAYLVIILVFFSCQNREQKNENNQGETEWIDPSQLQQSPVIRDSLTTDQMEQIDYVYNVFKEVDTTPIDKWIEDFKRDQNPDREIEIWMMMATAYTSYCKNKKLDLAVKKEVYSIVLMRSSAPEHEVLNHIKLVHLNEQEALKIMKAYSLEAKPITVVER